MTNGSGANQQRPARGPGDRRRQPPHRDQRHHDKRGHRDQRGDRGPREPRQPRGPRIPEGVDPAELDPSVINELRTLPEDMRDRVGGLLVAAEWALEDDEPASALEFTKEAKRLAGRVACVREAHGITSYRNARYADALSEFRAVRRMTGDDSFIPMMADCERGLGRPERALEVLKGFRPSDPALKIEAIIVGAGARGDAGQHEAALVMLDVPELMNGPDTAERLRLRYAYAATLEALGRHDEAYQWFATVAREDVDQLTDAHTRTTA